MIKSINVIVKMTKFFGSLYSSKPQRTQAIATSSLPLSLKQPGKPMEVFLLSCSEIRQLFF